MTEEFGAGIELDENLDLTVSAIGDIGATRGVNELEKDLAFQLNFALRQYLGEKPTENLKAEVKNTAKQVVELDTRVIEFDERSATVSFPAKYSQKINLTVPVVTRVGEQFVFVFEVE